MSEEVITTKRGRFGKLQVTIPVTVKNSILSSIDQSGLCKAEYLRIPLMMGSAQIASGIKIMDFGGKDQ